MPGQTDRRTDGRTEGGKDGWRNRGKVRQTLFYRTLLATPGGPKKQLDTFNGIPGLCTSSRQEIK